MCRLISPTRGPGRCENLPCRTWYGRHLPNPQGQRDETPTHYTASESGTACKIHVLRSMSNHDLTREEAKELIEKRTVGPFDDFVSKKTGNGFAASLYLRKNEVAAYKFAKKS